jgi:hypothetical protein
MRAELETNRSILDSVVGDMTRLQKSLGPKDRTRVAEYLDAVREVERRIHKAQEHTDNADLSVPERPVGIPDTYDEHVKLMFDLQWLAYQTDITRVFSFMLGREQSPRTFPALGINDGHHSISHHQDDPKKIANMVKINTYQVGLLAYFHQKLQSTPDVDGTLLDNSMVLYGSGLCNGNLHDHKNLPVVMVGGGAGQLKGGRHIKYAEQTPMANLLLGMLDKAGIHLDTFGDSTSRIDLEPLSI